jgi:RNA polymerase sigma-70 factor, ECF subfamily
MASFDAIYRAYSAYVAYIGVRILGRQAEIDDLVQDVFVEALRGLGKLKDAAAVKAWLATVTVRVATRRLRVRKLKRLLGLGTLKADLVWPGASPEQMAEVARVYDKLERVPVKHRIAWVLRMVEGEPLPHVAESCGCSLATAKRWIQSVQDQVASGASVKAEE